MIDNQLPAICEAVAELNAKYGRAASLPTAHGAYGYAEILGALNEFMESVRYLNTRRTDAAVLTLDSEAAVQDAVYLMLRPWVTDLVPEDPTGKVASRFTIKDFLCPSARTVIEAKYIRDRDHGKGITKEMHDDIETYRHHQYCEHLIFFVYDPDVLIPDRGALARQIHAARVYDGIALTCHLVVKP